MDEYTSTPAAVAATAVSPSNRTAILARVGLLGIGAAAILAAAVLAFGASVSPAGTLAAGSEGATSGANETVLGIGGPGGPVFRGGHGFGGITITAIDGSNLSLETVDGWTRTITVDDGTEYSKSGEEIALGDLAVGDEIGFRQTREDDGTFTIDHVVVIPPHAAGEVTAIDGSTITVERRDGTTSTITVSEATSFEVNGDEATLADVEVGMVLVAEGTENADGSLAATDVRAGDPGELRGGGHGPRGFKLGPGFDGPRDTTPDATEAPTADDTAS